MIDYVYNVEDYVGHNELKAMTAICHDELKNVNFEMLINELTNAKKDSWESWRYSTGNADKLVDFVDGVTDGIINPLEEGVGSWLFLILFSIEPECVINSIIKKTFPRTVDAVNKLPGIVHAHLNKISPHFRVPPHVDDPEGRIKSIIVTFKISNTSPELVTLDVTGNKHNFKDVEYFVFESRKEHYADNLSDSDWVLMSLQIKNEYFKNV